MLSERLMSSWISTVAFDFDRVGLLAMAFTKFCDCGLLLSTVIFGPLSVSALLKLLNGADAVCDGF